MFGRKSLLLSPSLKDIHLCRRREEDKLKKKKSGSEEKNERESKVIERTRLKVLSKRSTNFSPSSSLPSFTPRFLHLFSLKFSFIPSFFSLSLSFCEQCLNGSCFASHSIVCLFIIIFSALVTSFMSAFIFFDFPHPSSCCSLCGYNFSLSSSD